MILKKGDIGPEVAKCQALLNEAGAVPSLGVDGVFGTGTEAAVARFQEDNGLIVDGVIGPLTYNALRTVTGGENSNGGGSKLPKGVDEFSHLPAGEYIHEVVKKLGVCLHLTVSDGDPDAVAFTWANDSRGPVGTHYVIGRTKTNGDARKDGKVLQCIDLKYWAYHVKTSRMGFSSKHDKKTNQSYVGIELCSWGALKKVGDQFFDLSGRIPIPADQVCTLEKPFRTYKYWHKFTPAQIAKTFVLLKALGEELGIDWTDLSYEPDNAPNVDADWLEMDWDAMVIGMGYGIGRKLISHTTLEYGKFDVFPQPELLDMISALYKGEEYVPA